MLHIFWGCFNPSAAHNNHHLMPSEHLNLFTSVDAVFTVAPERTLRSVNAADSIVLISDQAIEFWTGVFLQLFAVDASCFCVLRFVRYRSVAVRFPLCAHTESV